MQTIHVGLLNIRIGGEFHMNREGAHTDHVAVQPARRDGKFNAIVH